MTDEIEIGPVDYMVVEFPGNKMTGEGIPILLDLHDSGVIRILDLAFVTKDADGAVDAWRSPTSTGTVCSTSPCSAASPRVCWTTTTSPRPRRVLEPNSSAGILVFENAWAAPFVGALHRAAARSSSPAAASPLPTCWRPSRPPTRATDSRAPEPPTRRPRQGPGKDVTMPGLIRGVARTAAVVGTASAVNGRVQRHQQQKFTAQDQAAYDAQQAQAAPPPQQYAPPPPQPQYAPPPRGSPAATRTTRSSRSSARRAATSRGSSPTRSSRSQKNKILNGLTGVRSAGEVCDPQLLGRPLLAHSADAIA